MTPTAAVRMVAERVKRDFRSGVRAGVVTTPTLFLFLEGRAELLDPAELERRLRP